MEEHGEPFYLFTEATQSINLEPQEINKGNCENWAVYVTDRLPQAESVWLDDEPDGPAHCAVLLNGRYYDSECLFGVEDWHDLPIARRTQCQQVKQT